MNIGPQVAFVDDIKTQMEPLDNILQKLNTGTVFFNAQPDANAFPKETLSTIKLLFLDLYYKNDFDADVSAEWVASIIPPNQKYALVIFSKDTHHEGELISVLQKIDLSPQYVEAWQKTDYPENFDFSNKVSSLLDKLSDRENIEEEIVFGEIIEIEEDGILVNCRLTMENPTFQVRRFNSNLISNIDNVSVGTYLKIRIFTKPGAMLIDIFEEKTDRSNLFKAPDYFSGLENNSFFKEG